VYAWLNHTLKAKNVKIGVTGSRVMLIKLQ
jgi:hypothetical protein